MLICALFSRGIRLPDLFLLSSTVTGTMVGGVETYRLVLVEVDIDRHVLVEVETVWSFIAIRNG